MGPNVKIIRHPNIVLPSFWSHHEKIVIIDHTMAFIGGLDLCYGRYDNKNHSI
jgi:phospholipase D1/2